MQVLVDGPSSGVVRTVRNLKDLQLTKFRLPIRLQQRTKNVKKVWDEQEISKKWGESTWAKKLSARATVIFIVSCFCSDANVYRKLTLQRAKLTDFDRYKLMRAKQSRNRLVRAEFAKLRKAANKA